MSSEQKPPRVCWLHPNAIDTLADNGAEYRAAIASKRNATLESWTGETIVIERPAWIQLIEATPEVLAAREIREALERLAPCNCEWNYETTMHTGGYATQKRTDLKQECERCELLSRIRAGEKGKL